MKKTKNAAEKIVSIDPFRVKPFKGQPRKDFRGIARLAANIEAIGQLTPIVVSKCDEQNFDYQLIDGERRLKACRHAEIEIEAVVRKDPGAERFALSVASNFHRQSHNCIEISDAIQTLKQSGRTLKEISVIFGKSITFIMQHDSLVRLHPKIRQQLVQPAEGKKRERFGGSGRMTLSLGLLLVPLPLPTQLLVAERIAAKKMDLAAARRLVMQQARKAGVNVGSITSASDHVNRLLTLLKKVQSTVGEYMDMPFANFERIRTGAALSQRKRLDSLIEDVTTDLLSLAENLSSDKSRRKVS